MAGNSNLKDSFKNRQDEFYTQLPFIENELKHYKNHFKGKTVFCNCDDPEWSNFWKYFMLKFNDLELKHLVATHYEEEKPSYKLEYDGHNITKTKLQQNGDFRSPECIEILKESDIICTNPPFSLFREYIEILLTNKKDFLIVGNQNAVAYKDFFPYISSNTIWLGYNAGHFWFRVPDWYEEKKTDFKIDEDGVKWRRMGNICWYTNLDIAKRHEDMILFKSYNKEDYPTYDNFEAIEVSKTADIPMDYDGVMGVPITFVSQHNPEQFEILGLSQKYGFGLETTKTYDDYREIKEDGTPTGSSGKKTNGNPMIKGKPKKGNYYQLGDEIVHSLYSRIFIRRKQ